MVVDDVVGDVVYSGDRNTSLRRDSLISLSEMVVISLSFSFPHSAYSPVGLSVCLSLCLLSHSLSFFLIAESKRTKRESKFCFFFPFSLAEQFIAIRAHCDPRTRKMKRESKSVARTVATLLCASVLRTCSGRPD